MLLSFLLSAAAICSRKMQLVDEQAKQACAEGCQRNQGTKLKYIAVQWNDLIKNSSR